MDAGLSDRAKRQLQINGSVTYTNQLPALRDKYVPHLLGTVSQLQEENAAISGVLANKGTLANLKPTDLAKIGVTSAAEITPEFITNLASMKQSNDRRIQNLLTTVGHLKSDDFSDISGSNFEPIAGAMYSRDWMKNVAEGFSYDFTKNTMKADPVQMLFYREHMENARQEDKQQFDLGLKKMELEYQLLGKSGNLKMMLGMGTGQGLLDASREDNPTTSPFSSVDKASSYDEVTNKWTEINGQMGKLDTWLLDKLKSFGLDSSVTSTDDARFKNFYENFKTTASSDPEKVKIVDQYENQLGKYVSVADLYKNTLDNVDAQTAHIDKQNKQDISQINPVVLKDGTVVTPNMIYNLILNPNKEINGLKFTMGPYELAHHMGIYHGSLFYKGTMVQGGISAQEDWSGDIGSKLHPLFEKVRDKLSTGATKLSDARNEIMNRETVLQRESYAFPFLNNNESTFKTRIAQRIGLPLKYIDDLTVGDTDLDGRLIVRLNTDRAKATKEYDASSVLHNLKNYGGKDNPVLSDDASAVMLSGINELDLLDTNKLSSVMQPYMRSIEKRVDVTGKPQSTGFIRSSMNNTSYRLDVAKSYNGGFDYVIYDKNNPTSPVYSTEQRDDALGKFNILVEEKKTISVPKK